MDLLDLYDPVDLFRHEDRVNHVIPVGQVNREDLEAPHKIYRLHFYKY